MNHSQYILACEKKLEVSTSLLIVPLTYQIDKGANIFYAYGKKYRCIITYKRCFFDEVRINSMHNNLEQGIIRKILGRYQIQRQIGHGGMGDVWLGEDPRLHRQVAIKTLPIHYHNDRE